MIQSSDAPSISIRLDRIALLSSGTIHTYVLSLIRKTKRYDNALLSTTSQAP